jgi:hypothetical protein
VKANQAMKGGLGRTSGIALDESPGVERINGRLDAGAREAGRLSEMTAARRDFRCSGRFRPNS